MSGGRGKPEVQDLNTSSDTWNVAEGYVKLKVLRPLVMLDKWETIAFFGSETPEEARELNENETNQRRIDALNRYYHLLLQLLGNTYFTIRKQDRHQHSFLRKRVENCYTYIKSAYMTVEDPITHVERLEIDEKKFDAIFRILKYVKDDLNTILNNAHLIFRQSEELDLEHVMNEIIEGG